MTANLLNILKSILLKLLFILINLAVFIIFTSLAYQHIGLINYSAEQTPKRYFPIILEQKENPTIIIESEWRKLENGRFKDEKYSPSLSATKGHIIRRGDAGEELARVAFKKEMIKASTQVEVTEYTEDYTITSLYRIDDGTVEPISLHIGHGTTGLVALPFGILGWFITRTLIVFIKKRRDRSKSRNASVLS